MEFWTLQRAATFYTVDSSEKIITVNNNYCKCPNFKFLVHTCKI